MVLLRHIGNRLDAGRLRRTNTRLGVVTAQLNQASGFRSNLGRKPLA